jgi:hypothetical protein
MSPESGLLRRRIARKTPLRRPERPWAAKPVNLIRVGRILLLLGKIRTQKRINLLLEISPFAIVYVDGSRQLNELLIE